MPPTPATTAITGQLLFLGTGTSVGVPMIGCHCGTCASDNPRNQRTRSSIVLGLPGGNLLIDTAPDLRQQLLRERLGLVHAVAYTHEHADHIFGLDDLRLFQFYLGGPVPLYCEERVADRIRKSFDYAFAEPVSAHAGATPKLELRPLAPNQPVEILGVKILPLRLRHGVYDVLGFRIGDIAYCTDTNGIPPESMRHLTGLDVLILDALRPHPHPTHFSLDEAIAVAEQLAPRQTYLTHIAHELEHEATTARLPPHIRLAYDGLRIPLR